MYASLDTSHLYFDIDGAKLRPTPDGLVTMPTVVVLHGGPGFDQGYLRPGIGALRDLAQLVFVDLRGQGRSGPVPVETCTLSRMAADVVDLCDYLGLERPYLFGHSAGGFVALHAALQAPDAFGGLILCNTAATLAPEPESGAPTLAERAGPEAAAVAARLFGGDVSAETGEAFARLVAPYYAAPDHPEVPAQLFPLSPPTVEVIHHFFSGEAASYDVRDRLADIDLPTLVVAGAWDWVCPPAAGRTIASSIPGARLVHLDRAGHFSFSEEPAAFHDAVASFLAPREALVALD